MKTENKSTLGKVKDIIDLIYSETTASDGFHHSFRVYSSRTAKVAKILLDRGILLRDGTITKPVYTWNKSAMSPTENLYKTITTELRTKESNAAKKSKDKKMAEMRKTVCPVPLPEKMGDARTPISEYTDQEIWDELKSRGFSIEDNALVKRIILN